MSALSKEFREVSAEMMNAYGYTNSFARRVADLLLVAAKQEIELSLLQAEYQTLHLQWETARHTAEMVVAADAMLAGVK